MGPGFLMMIIQFTAHIAELAESCLTKDHDIDNTKIKSCLALSSLIGICQDFDIDPYKPTRIVFAIEQKRKVALLLEMSTNFVAQVLKTKFFGIAFAIHEIERLGQEIIQLLKDIAMVTSIHELMRIRIEHYAHHHIELDKQLTLQMKPFMKNLYENYPIMPLKFKWNPKSSKLIEFLEKCTPLELDKEMTTEQLVKTVLTRLLHRIYEHNESQEQVHHELSYLLNFSAGDFSLDDKRSIQWPILLHTYSSGFEDKWKSVYPELLSSTPPAQTNKRKLCEVLAHNTKQSSQQNGSIEVPESPERDQDVYQFTNTEYPV